MFSRDVEVRALRLESLKLVQQAENVLNDLRAHQCNLERFLSAVRGSDDITAREGGR